MLRRDHDLIQEVVRMSAYRARRWGTGLLLATGAGLAAATTIGMGTANADPVHAAIQEPLLSSHDNAVPDLANLLFGGDAAAASADAVGVAGSPTPDDLLNSASTNLTDAIQTLNQIDVSNLGLEAVFVNISTDRQGELLQSLGQLQSAQDTISAHAGSLSNLVDQVFFVPLDQGWDQHSEALLNADQALATAAETASNSGHFAAQFDVLESQLLLTLDMYSSYPVVVAGDLLSLF